MKKSKEKPTNRLQSLEKYLQRLYYAIRYERRGDFLFERTIRQFA